MLLKRLPSHYLSLLLLVIGATIVPAQLKSPDFNRRRVFDVQHYKIVLALNPSAKTISAVTTISLKPLKDGLAKLSLDSVGLKYRGVTSHNGEPLPYTTGAGKINITLPRSYSRDEVITVRFDYEAKPTKGIYFVDELRNGSRVVQSAQAWTQGEPEEARHWFPSYDFPDDKATSEQTITAGPGETVISNGELKSATDNPNGTRTFHYFMGVPHSTYLMSFVVGKYVRTADALRDVPLSVYTYPERPTAARDIFAKTADMMRAYEQLTGVPYPYNKYDQTIVANFNFGGMENITATTLSDRDVYLAATPLGKDVVEDLISHELAHSWFGNMVTCRNWAELWLNEGFATFMEAAWRERAYGRENYIAKLRSDIGQYFFDDARGSRRHGLYNLLAKPDDSIFDSTTYKKGGAVVHMLRDTVGDEIFWKAINTYLSRHRFDNVTSSDLKSVFEEESGKDLTWFFEQWVYGTGYPKLRITSTYSRRTGALTVAVSQTQAPGRLTPAAFRLPLDIAVQTPSGVRMFSMPLLKRTEVASFALGEIPDSIEADPAFRIPVKSVEVSSVTIR